MKQLYRPFALLLVMVLSAMSLADGAAVEQDSRAIEILKKMDAYKAGLKTFVVRGASSSDSRMRAGLIVSDTSEITVSLQQPGSIHFSSFDGVDTREMYLHDGQLTLHDSRNNVYGQVDTPKQIDAALDYALDEFDIDLPLMDLLKKDTFNQLVTAADSVYYLTDKARVLGVDCHHIAIRTEEVDVQLWVEEGDEPLARRIVLTYKWAGGAPRFVGNMSWDKGPELEEKRFEFKPPKDASKIDLLEAQWQ